LISHPKGRTQIEVFENWVLKRISALKREEVTRGWRKLHSEELHDLQAYCLPYNIGMIISRGIRWRGISWHGEDGKFIQNFSRKT
jgi:hypothetical protein